MLDAEQAESVMRLFRLSHDVLALVTIKLLYLAVDPPRVQPDGRRGQVPQVWSSLVRRAAAELCRLGPGGFAPVGDLPRRLPAGQASDVVQPLYNPVSLGLILEL